ncbi:dephospho-CoA kinase [Burkholderiales bacterium JOSHI_001]|nr:dephospho-CoA kinase [Burkholderiales bacterium JOSHI_001]
MGAGFRRIGLTGGIGSGKSTVAQALVALGAHLVDTDAIARDITAPGGAAMAPLRDAFGPDMVDASGALDRARMRALAFGSPEAKARLEAVLHPMIGQEAQRRAAEAGERAVVFDVPLLGEHSVWRQRCERILVVDCGADTQIERVVQRSGWPREQVQAVIAQQVSREQRLRLADAVIHNDGIDLQRLQDEVAALWRLWAPAGA